jgi:hypothetical protein
MSSYEEYDFLPEELHSLTSFPRMGGFRVSSDDSLAALDEAVAFQYAEMTIAELMQRDVDRKGVGSRVRRRRSSRAKSMVRHENGVICDDVTARIGRPTIGAEARVCVQTSIALRTREILAAVRMTLADVFDAYARGLMAHGG